MFKSNFNSELALYGENKNFQISEVNAYKSLRLDMKNFQIIKVQLSTSFEKNFAITTDQLESRTLNKKFYIVQ